MNIPVAPRQGQKGLQMITLLSVAVTVISALIPGSGQNLVVVRLLPALAISLALVFWLASRRLSYTLADGQLIIGKLTGPVRWPYAGMTVRRASRGLGLNMGGTGVPGDDSGNSAYGGDGLNHVQVAASKPSGGVLVSGGSRTNDLIPADAEAFVHSLIARGAQVRA
ncbi:hypothetical protein [Deinococcus hohokamensis]|uniref:Bacterial Pleckstrin homology domain-containing protein n=1 Tax=Deinococcus hohokamensis TaxID=309883 RepID=A0ABV9I4I0_9DEIO